MAPRWQISPSPSPGSGFLVWPVAFLALLPLFIELGTLRSNLLAFALATPPELGQAIHISLLLVPLLIAVVFVRNPTVLPVAFNHLPRMVSGLFAIALAFATTALFVAAMTSPIISIDRHLQMIAVVLPLFIAPKLRLDSHSFMRAVMVASNVGLLVILAYLFRNGGLQALAGVDRLQINKAFPQILVYLPFLAVIGLGASLVASSQWLPLRLITAVISMSFLAVNYSRTTIALAALAAIIAGAVPAPGRRSVVGNRAGRVLGGVVVAAIVFVLASASVGGDRFRESASAGRSEILSETLSRLARSPILGEGFVPRSETNLKPWDTHNQFLEMFMRSGLLGGACAIAAIFLLAKALISNRPSVPGPVSDLHRLATVVFGAALAGGMANVYLTQLFPGVFVWLLVGLALSNRRSTRRPQLAGQHLSAARSGVAQR